MSQPPVPSSRWRAIIRGECPRCRRAPIFRALWTMNEKCPTCGLEFDREPGYFTGAMYISYALAVPVAATVALASSFIFPDWSFEMTIAAAFSASGKLAVPVTRLKSGSAIIVGQR